jgi:hypothetical protein
MVFVDREHPLHPGWLETRAFGERCRRLRQFRWIRYGMMSREMASIRWRSRIFRNSDPFVVAELGIGDWRRYRSQLRRLSVDSREFLVVIWPTRDGSWDGQSGPVAIEKL